MNCLFAVKKYIHYYFKSIDEYKIHSPFVFDFYTHVIKDNTLYDDYEVVSYLKDYLKKNPRKIKITDYGSGNYDLQRSISDITKKSSQWDSYAQLLYRMMRYYRFSYFIELGTSFGLTAIYLGLANA